MNTSVKIFTDGACSKNGKVGARASWSCWFPDHKHLSKAEQVPDSDLQTNQRGELMAITKAVEISLKSFPSGETDLHIYTDSMYSKNCLTTWLPKWIRNDWKNTQGQPVAHRDLIEYTSTNLSKFKTFTISYVEAHTGNDDELSRNNAIADKMATDILNSSEETTVKVISSNKQEGLEGLPLTLMGPPLSETSLLNWIKSNLDKLDSASLNSALITALSKTLKKKGFEVTKQRLHRSSMYRLVTANHLIVDNVSVIKEDE